MRVALFSLALISLAWSAPAQARVGKGQKAPDFSLASLDGKRLSLSSLQGKVVLLDFWAQWCEPCKRELPQLEKLSKDYAAKGVVVLSVNIDKVKDNAERLVRQLGVSFDVLLDPVGSVVATYDLPKMPSSFVLDKRGVVRYIHEGFDGSSDIDRFRKELDELSK